jgi:hypothetical protein
MPDMLSVVKRRMLNGPVEDSAVQHCLDCTIRCLDGDPHHTCCRSHCSVATENPYVALHGSEKRIVVQNPVVARPGLREAPLDDTWEVARNCLGEPGRGVSVCECDRRLESARIAQGSV